MIKFDDTEIEEYEFHQYKSPISIKYIDIKKIVVSNEFSFGKQDFKYFIGYKDSEKIRSLCIFYPQMIIYKRYFDENGHIHVLTKKKIEKVSNTIKNKFNSKLIYSEEYLKAKKIGTKRDFQCL